MRRFTALSSEFRMARAILGWDWLVLFRSSGTTRPPCSVFATDITDRKQLEDKVAEGEILLRHLVEAANDIIFITDEKGLFTYVNPSGLRISGYSEEEVIGKHFTELIVQEYRERTETFYKKQFARGVLTHTIGPASSRTKGKSF